MASYSSPSDSESESAQSAIAEWITDLTHNHSVFERQGSGRAYRKSGEKARSGEMPSSRSSTVASTTSHQSEQSSTGSHHTSVAEKSTVIHAPAIHQEVITHHRHIDHGFQHVTYSTPAPVHYASARVQDEAEKKTLQTTFSQAQKVLPSEDDDAEFAAFTKANDLKFENDLRRLIWSSAVSSDVFYQLVELHKTKQERKREIHRHGPQAFRTLSIRDRGSQDIKRDGSAIRSASSDYSQQPRDRGRSRRTRSEKKARDTPLGNVVFQVAPDDKHRHKISIPPQARFVYIGGSAGNVESGLADGAPQHAENSMPDDETHDERQRNSLPHVPTPPPEPSQAVERKARTSRPSTSIKEDLLIELMDKLLRKIDTMVTNPGVDSQATPPEENEAAYQAAKASTNSITYSDNEPQDESQQESSQNPIKQIAGPPRRRKPPPWKRQQKNIAQSSVPVAA